VGIAASCCSMKISNILLQIKINNYIIILYRFSLNKMRYKVTLIDT